MGAEKWNISQNQASKQVAFIQNDGTKPFPEKIQMQA